MRYLDTVLPQNGMEPVPRRRLWIIVQGYGLSEEESAVARRAAAATGAGAVLVALARIDQSYEPRIVPVR